jgi:hypothetical protein
MGDYAPIQQGAIRSYNRRLEPLRFCYQMFIGNVLRPKRFTPSGAQPPRQSSQPCIAIHPATPLFAHRSPPLPKPPRLLHQFNQQIRLGMTQSLYFSLRQNGRFVAEPAQTLLPVTRSQFAQQFLVSPFKRSFYSAHGSIPFGHKKTLALFREQAFFFVFPLRAGDLFRPLDPHPSSYNQPIQHE